MALQQDTAEKIKEAADVMNTHFANACEGWDEVAKCKTTAGLMENPLAWDKLGSVTVRELRTLVDEHRDVLEHQGSRAEGSQAVKSQDKSISQNQGQDHQGRNPNRTEGNSKRARSREVSLSAA